MAIKIHRIKTHSPEWHQFRTVGIPDVYDGGIGASEIGIILGINPYRPTLMELYHHKVGSESREPVMNEYMFHGLMLEDYVADLWQYWDGTPDGYMNNKVDGQKKRSMHRVNGYIVNDKYPWLFVSLDRMMNKGQVMLVGSGELLAQECPLECKNISHYASQLWEAGIPPYYIAQVNQQMLVTDTKYCEIAILKDGRKFDVIPLERSERICAQIIEQSYAFWQTVLKARRSFKEKRLAEKRGDYTTARNHEGIIQQLEPMPDENEGYKDYMNERFVKEVDALQGNEEDFSHVKSILALNSIEKELKKRKSKLVNLLTHKLVVNSAEKLDFGGSGYIRYAKRKNAKKNGLFNGVKPKPSDEWAKQQLNKFNLSGNYF